MNEDSARPMTLFDAIRVLRQHRQKILVWCLFVFATAIAALIFLPKKYSSAAKLYVRLGRESVALDPTATMGQTLQITESRENQINSARDMLKSRVMCERIVDKLGPEVILFGPPRERPTGVSAVISSMAGLAPSMEWIVPITPREKAIEKLAASVNTEVAKNSSVIDIKVKAKTPKLAQEILQEFINHYQNQYLLANRTSGSQSFFADQVALLKRQLDEHQAKLRDAKNTADLVSVPTAQTSLQTEMVLVESNALTCAAAMASSNAAVAAMEELLTQLPKSVPLQQTSGFANAAADSMRQELFKAEMSLRQLEAKLGPDHPDVKVAREQVTKSAIIVSNQDPDRAQSTQAVNPSYQAMELDLRREQAKAAALSAQSATLTAQHDELVARLEKLNASEITIANLERQVALAESNYRHYVESFEQARVDQAIEAHRISNVNVIQPPSLVEKPASPKVLYVFAAAICAAFGGSMVLAFGSEFLNRAPAKIEDIEAVTGRPVMASIPHVETEQHVYIHS
jgi:uncharacterized protein involved in exopolysaccharide biosynthesis